MADRKFRERNYPVFAKFAQYFIVASESNLSFALNVLGKGPTSARGAPNTYANSSPITLKGSCKRKAKGTTKINHRSTP